MRVRGVLLAGALARLCGALEPVPRAADVVTMVNRDAQKDVRLDANLYIPDGGELLLNVDVPREAIRIDSQAPAKVTRVFSSHADGVVGVGEAVDVFVEFTSAVDVLGAPWLALATGCHASACHTREVQRLWCQGTTGKFAVAFDGQRVVNIPWDASAKQLAKYLQRMTKLDRVLVEYLQDDGNACTFFGNNITVTFESVNIDGADGDLPEMTADAANIDGDGAVLGHVRLAPSLSPNAWEIQKGKRVPDRLATFVGKPDPRTLQFTYTVQDGDNTTRLDYVNSDALTRSLGNSIQVRNAGTLVKADTSLPPPGFAGDWERGIGSSLSANSRIQVDVTQPRITSITSPHEDGTFGIGEVILVHVVFSLPVVVSGMPTIVLETGQVDRIIPFVQVTGANQNIVEFRYIVQARDTTPDLTYTGTAALSLNGGSIKRKSTTSTTDAILTLLVNGERGSLSWSKNIVIDTSNPKVTGVSAISPDGTYTGGDTIQIQVAFDTPVIVTGSPQLMLSTGSVDLFPGSFIQVAPTLLSSKTVVFPSVDHGLSTQQSSGLQFLIDGQVYSVATVSGDAVTMVEDYAGSVVDPTIIGGPSIKVQSPGYRPARYTSGSGTRSLVFTYDVQRGDSSSDLAYTSSLALQLNGGAIQRLSTTPFSDADLTLATPGTLGSLSFSSNVVINTDPPRVVLVNSITRDGVYRAGDEIYLSVVFDLPVAVLSSASIQTTVGAGERVAAYIRGSGSTSLVFKFSCVSADQISVFDVFDGKSLKPAYGYVSGAIRRQSSAPLIPAVLDLPVAGLASKGISIDQGCAYITGVSTTHEDATAGAGELIDVQVTYNVPVNVDTSTGTPTLQLTSQKTATYFAGTGSTILTFRYIVQRDDPRVRLTYVDIYSLQLNGGRIVEASATKIASTLLPTPQSTRLTTQQYIYIDTQAPVVTDVSTNLLDGVYTVGDKIIVAVTMSASVVLSAAATNRGTPTLYLHLGGATSVATPAIYDSSNDDQLYFTLTIANGQSTSNLAYPARTSLRCVGNFGINVDGVASNAITPHGVEFQGRLLVMWSESSVGAPSQIRARSLLLARRFGETWTQEDGDGVTGRIQFNAAMDATNPMLLALDGTRLYACWQERNALTGNPTQIRVATYIGGDVTVLQRWRFVGRAPTTANGLNRDPARSAAAPHLTVHSNRLYMAWHESTASTATQIRVALYNGQDLAPSWTFVDGNSALRGINVASARSAQNVRMISCRSTLFATWEELNSAGISQIRVSTLGGTDAAPRWSVVDGNVAAAGLNFDPSMHARVPSIACVLDTTLIVAWHEIVNVGGGGTRTRIRAKQASLSSTLAGIAWTPADMNRGLNFDINQNAVNVRLRTHPLSTSSLYATWEETDQVSGKRQVRAALFTGGGAGSWLPIDGNGRLSTVNDATSQDAFSPVLVASTTSATTLYAIWHETHATTLTTHVRASLYSSGSEAFGIWQSLHDRCVLRKSTTPTTSANLLLPELNSLGSLEFGRQLRIDTARPTVQNVSFASSSAVVAMAGTIQTVDVFNQASLTQGQYKLAYDGEETACIAWNAPAAAVKAALEGISTMALRVDVMMDTTVIQDAARYIITFTFPTTGIKPLALISSNACASWTCSAAAPRLPCNLNSLTVLNVNRDILMRSGIVDIMVNFSSPVAVTTGTPQLTLETGTIDAMASYTARGILREFDVGTESSSMMLSGAFRLAYGDAATPNAMETTECIDASFLSHADAEQELLFKLRAIKALRTIGIQSVSRQQRGNGYRYKVFFPSSTSGDLLDLIPADASACEGFTGRTQTIDVRADAVILQGGFSVGFQYEKTPCISAIVRASGPTSSLQDTLSRVIPDRVLPLQVKKDTSVLGARGHRYYITFMSLSDAMFPLEVSTTNCAAFMCDDGNGATVACTGVKVTANTEFKTTLATTKSLAFQYPVQATDKTSALAIRDSSALSGSIFRQSQNPVLQAVLAVPSGLLAPSTIRILSSDEIPRVTRVFSSTLDDTYTAGDVLVIYVVFSLAVDVVGRPILELNSGGVAKFLSGSGTTQLEFRYKILPGEASVDLNYASTLSLRTPGLFVNIYAAGSMDKPEQQIMADLTLPALVAATSLASQHALVVMTSAPTIVSVTSSRVDTPPRGVGYGVGDIIDVQVVFSSEVAVRGTPQLALSSGGVASFTYAGYRQLLDVGVHAVYPVTNGQFAITYRGVMSRCIDVTDPNSASPSSLTSRLLAFSELATIGVVSVTRSPKKNGFRFEIIFDSTRVLEVPASVIPVVSDVCGPLLPSSPDTSPERLLERSTDTSVVFHYYVQENDATNQLDYTSISIDMAVIGSAIQARSRTPTVNADVTLPVAGSATRLGALKLLVVDGSPVVVVDVVSDSDAGTYGVAYPPIASPPTVYPGEIYFRLIFSRSVKVIGTPTMELATGSLQVNGLFTPNRLAVFVGQPKPNEAAFLYHIQEGDGTANLAFANLNVLASATIFCVSTSSLTMARTAPLPRLLVSATKVLRIDANSVPTTVKLSSPHPDGFWGAGEAIEIEVTFSKQVTLQTGLNRNHDFYARYPTALEYGDNLIVFWTEWSTFEIKPALTRSFLYMRAFARDTLEQVSLSSPVAAAMNRFPNTFIEKVSVTLWQNDLYTAWDENGFVYCARFNGLGVPKEPWTVIPSMEANKNLQMRGSDAQLIVHNLELVMVWREEAIVSPSGRVAGQIRVAQRNDDYDAPLWIFHDGDKLDAGLNRNPKSDAILPHTTVYRGAMYISWSEYSDELDAYQIIIARRFVQSRDVSVWQYLNSTSAASDFYINNYRPRLSVRKNGFEDVALIVTWYRDTNGAGVSEVASGEVLDTSWYESASSIARQTNFSSPKLPSAKALDTLACGNTMFASWIEESPVSVALASHVQRVRIASLGQDRSLQIDWATMFSGRTANHNPLFDVTDVALVCSLGSNMAGMFWTEFDGIATKLHLRHARIAQRLEAEMNITWGETSSGTPLLQMDTGANPNGVAYAIDRSGFVGKVLRFLYVVLPGHMSLDLDVLTQQALEMNGARIRDYFDQIPDFTLFPRSRDPRSLSYNNNIQIDSSPPVVVDVTSTTASGEYGVGEVLLIQVVFSLPVDVSGAPAMLYLRSDELHFTDYNVDPAVYVSGSGTTTLSFQYTTTERDYSERLDYFRTDSLVLLSGASIRRNSTFPMVDAVLTLPEPRSAHSLSGNRRISIKPTAPAVTSVTSPLADGTYYPGDTIPIIVTFTLPVIVYGQPVLLLETGQLSTAVYEDGNTTTTLTFRYVIEEGDASRDLDVVDDRGSSVINYVHSLQLAGMSSIKRKSTNPYTNADITLPAPGWPGSLSANKNFVIDTVRPKIVDIRSPTPDGTYDVADTITILVEFSKKVVVRRAEPYLKLNVPLPNPLDTARTAVYRDGSDTNVLRFEYTVASNDNTGTTPLDTFNEKAFLLRPIVFGGSMWQTAAEVLCKATSPTQPANLTMPRPGPILRADAVRSLVGNNRKIFLRTDGLRVVALNADVKSGETYAPGQRIVLSVIFSRPVVVQGSPRLGLNANALLPTYAQYIGGSSSTELKFEYIVLVGDSVQVLEAASRRALELPAGSLITDSDGVYVPLRLGAPLLPGSLSFNYRIGVSSMPPVVQRVYINNIDVSSDGAFGVGDDVVIAVQFSIRVAMPTGATPPSLRLQFANGVRTASYTSGDKTSTWLFTIRIAAGDATSALAYSDINALVVGAAPNGLFAAATTLVLAANTVLPALGSPGSLSSSGVRVVSAPPTVVAVSALDRDGVYALGDRVRIRIQFSYRVTVVTPAACLLELFLGGSKTVTATYVGGALTNALVFEYRIVAGDRSGRLDYRSVSSLSCNILQMTANPSLAADTTLPLPGADGSLGFASRIQVDFTAPRVVSVSSTLANGLYGSGQDIDVLMTFSEPIEVVDPARCNPKLRLSIANAQQIPRRTPVALYRSGTGSATITFRYTTRPGDMAFSLAYDGVDALYVGASDCAFVAATADRRPASIRLPTPGGSGSLSNNRDIGIDAVEPPQVVTVTSDMSDAIYTAGDVIAVAVVFTTPVVVTGTPYLKLDVGQPLARRALYQSGSGSSKLVFTYIIQPGDHSDRLDYSRCPDNARLRPRRREFDKLVKCLPDANALQLNGGTIQRSATAPSVDAILDLPEVNLWPKLRVATSRQDFVYVNQLEDTTDLPADERQRVLVADAARLLANERSVSHQKSSIYIYSNGIPSEKTSLKVTEQRYFIELVRFPVLQPNALSLKGLDGFIGVMLNGIPFKSLNAPATALDSCGGAIDEQNRYYYAAPPSCFITSIKNTLSLEESSSAKPFIMIGYAFDGFPLYYYFDEAGDFPKQLDECNGMRGRDGAYRYHLMPPPLAPFMPCLRGINDPPSAVRGETSKLIRVFRTPVEIRQVDGLTLSYLSRFDGLVVDENPVTATGMATWLNPTAVSVVYTATTITVRSTGIPNGQYGPFPNAYNRFVVREQDYAFQLPRRPTVAAQTTALPLDTPIGVMLNGVPFFSSRSNVYGGNVMDPTSRAYWMLDRCHGLVDAGGNYRYHGTPDCLLSELGGQLLPGKPSPLLGYALDGFPLYGPYTESGVVPTDLDACNGRIGDDGTYRYHVTPGKAPYLIGCFRGTPLANAANDQVQRSLSYAKALRVDTKQPRVTQLFTNKQPGVYTLSETLDLVVVWSHPVVVDITNGVPSVTIPDSQLPQPQAVYSATKSSSTQSVFQYTVTAAEAAELEYNYDFRSAIRLNGATIKRAASTPTLDAELQFIWAEHNSRFASKHQLVQDVRVVLRGLYHPHASDLSVRLYHETHSASIVDRCCGKMAFGLPDEKLRINEKQIRIHPSNPTSGVGWDYSFQDFVASKNLARDGGATALQSSTSGKCFASNAIDGRVRGSVSSQDVARADASPTTVAWWELRLLKPVEIGTIRVWFPQRPERRPATVQIVRIDSADSIAQVYGSFVLSFTTPDGQVYDTADINWNAVAMVRDEDAKIANLGIGKGESVEAKILAALPSTTTQRLYVTRSPADAGLSDHGAFTWSITFLEDPQLYDDGALPLAVAANNICDGLGVVSLEKPFPGDDYDEWAYITRDDDARAYDMTKGHTSMFPFWILLFEDTAVMSFESFHEAVNASTWSHRVDETMQSAQMISVNPPVGLTTSQFVRIVAETPSAFLTLAEVEVFRERNHLLSQYPSGSPIATEFYPGAETWSPEDSFQERFRGRSSEGRWTLSIRDAVASYKPSPEKDAIHGAGALSDWVLYVTNAAGNLRTYYMDIRAKVQTLPRHGKLYVSIAETDTEHLDRDRNGVLDLVEAETYLSRYYLSFDVLPAPTRQRVLVNFLAGYSKFGGIEILADPSERQKIYPNPVCDRECLEELGLDPYYWPGTTGDRALKPMVVGRDRIVRYIPNEGFLGLDTLTFSIGVGSQESLVAGTVEFHVRECQAPDCATDMELLHRTRID